MTKGNFEKMLRCEEFPGHFQQFPVTVLSNVRCSSRMAAKNKAFFSLLYTGTPKLFVFKTRIY